MNSFDWLLQIFQVSDDVAQQVAVSMLAVGSRSTVHAVTRGTDHFIFVDSTDEDQAQVAAALVECADARASLLHTARGPIGVTAAPRVESANLIRVV